MTSLREVRGQTAAVERLEHLLHTQRFPHALLIEGPEGVGKMRAARILAKILLCRAPRDRIEPCESCSSCRKVEAGTHADMSFVTTDDRSIKVDEIREAEKLFRLRAVEGGRKVLVFEAAHRMTLGAQNALLKTLEEPNGKACIILTASRVRWLLPTVVSRCQRLPFRPIPDAELAAILVEEDGLDPARARWIAALAQGSLGNTRSAAGAGPPRRARYTSARRASSVGEKAQSTAPCAGV
ncbi:MAG: DNA polymerase III subunit delta', partial [Myxococcales bacterium]|nr:DNA polymerase III subunit delta' [Myxococcales bacterium]